jgi:integrase
MKDIAPITGQSLGIAPRVNINWQQAELLRDIRSQELTEGNTDFPRYLILPEVEGLINSVLDQRHRLAILLLFLTGARVGELVKLKPQSFYFNANMPCTKLPTLKKRDNRKGKNKRHQAKLQAQGIELDKQPYRWVPFVDVDYQREVQSYIVTHRIKPFERLFPVDTRTIQSWIKKAVENYEQQRGQAFGFNVTPRTFRHSFAMNATLHGVPQRILQQWLGHESAASTVIYLQLLDVESHIVGKQVAWRVGSNPSTP